MADAASVSSASRSGWHRRCSASGAALPCGTCQACRYTTELTHPDLYWFFPVPRADIADSSPEEALAFMRGAMRDRAQAGGLWGPSSGSEGLFVEMIRSLVRAAASSPAMAKRKVMILRRRRPDDRPGRQRSGRQRPPQAPRGAAARHHADPHHQRAGRPAAHNPITRGLGPGGPAPPGRTPAAGSRARKYGPRSAGWTRPCSSAPRVRPAPSSPARRTTPPPPTPRNGSRRSAVTPRIDSSPVLSEKPAGARGGFADALDALEGLLHDRLPAVEPTRTMAPPLP